ncbi:MAG: hypothetical protein IJE49_00050 [Agathobacter sp.]|nr:hypothetical protein [Agathobacter sp.]MBQ2900224.1 hypothetical protein [Agathobacter sp.]
MNSDKAKKKNNIGQKISGIIILAAAGVCGGLAGLLLARAEEQGLDFWVGMLAMVLAVYGAMLIQTIVHEAGHLVFGLVSGYEFSSFRIGSLMLIKENGKMKLRKFSIAGTAGQCLMSPPDLVDGKMPVVLYNMGGCIYNLIFSTLSGVAAYIRREDPIEFIVYVAVAVIGVALALTNGIPMMVGPISNDGHNALSLGKNPIAMRAFWLQLKINNEQSKGTRLKTMPESWFAEPADADMDNGLVAALAVFRASWLIDQLRLEEAAEYIKNLLSKETGLVGLHRSLLICERIYCELVANKNVSEAIYLHNKEYEKFVQSMKDTPSVIRSEYAYAVLAEKDEKKAEKLLARFEKVTKTYPYPQEIEAERELIELVKREIYEINYN